MSRFDCLLAGGTVVRGDGTPPVAADLGVRDGLVAEIGDLAGAAASTVIDCAGGTLFPGFVDAHSHAEGSIFRDDVQLALLRQGVTSIVLGQDGVSLAPGDGRYGQTYFGALNGVHPSYQGYRVADLLAGYDGAVPVNVAYTVPLGTVRHEVLGHDPAAPDDAALRAMRRLVEQGLEDGAVGASSGLDYVPGRFAGAAELAAVLAPMRGTGAVYVTHLRGGYEERSGEGLDEAAGIALSAGVPLHVSHLHARQALIEEAIEGLERRGVDGSFDAYPYRRGFSLLAMPIVPEDWLTGAAAAVRSALAGPRGRARLVEEWFPRTLADTGGRFLQTRLAHVPSADHRDLEGRTIATAAAARRADPAALVHEVLVATELTATAIFAASRHTTAADYTGLLTHPWHLAGSDGIFVGGAPHPRAWGTFARLLAEHTGPGRAYTPDQAAEHLSGRAARRFGLAGRGTLAPGQAADIAVVDLGRVSDRATYDRPREPAAGIATVLVNGVVVLADGRLTGRRPGRSLRRRPP
ncbi:N-acyl-D-amino-acid deacylase family protein [Jiangella muralis]|uniref:N-acyl-D-amino-acid deacylase family protein n=1 Tax=Jiangella muralis TaxID=702383 RepID=UPI00069E4CF7|nr:amidohydrolase family protein [Jiangella muralis]